MGKFNNPLEILTSGKRYILTLLGLAIIYMLLGAGWAVCLYFYKCFLFKFWAMAGFFWFLAVLLIIEAFDEWRKTRALTSK